VYRIKPPEWFGKRSGRAHTLVNLTMGDGVSNQGFGHSRARP
jgi:hypothetical protein